MRTFTRFFVCAFLLIILGATGGLLMDDAKALFPINSSIPALKGPVVSVPKSLPAKSREQFLANEVDCLAEIVFREARSESVGIQRLTAITVIARRDDKDPQWPKTICGILRQPNQISQSDRPLNLGPREFAHLSLIRQVAEEVYEGAWKTQKLPRGWECVRYWRVSDEHLARMNSKKFEQLGISKSLGGLRFFEKLKGVDTPAGTVTFFRDPNRCVTALPTT